MTRTDIVRVLLALYPARWRDRYADEVTALVEQTGLGLRQMCDLLRGAAREWDAEVAAALPSPPGSRLLHSMRGAFRWFAAAFACCLVVTVLFDGPAQAARAFSLDAALGAAGVMLRVFLLGRIPVLLLVWFASRAGKPITSDERRKAQFLFGILAMVVDSALGSVMPGVSQQHLVEDFGSGASWFALLPAFLPDSQQPSRRTPDRPISQAHAS